MGRGNIMYSKKWKLKILIKIKEYWIFIIKYLIIFFNLLKLQINFSFRLTNLQICFAKRVQFVERMYKSKIWNQKKLIRKKLKIWTTN